MLSVLVFLCVSCAQPTLSFANPSRNRNCHHQLTLFILQPCSFGPFATTSVLSEREQLFRYRSTVSPHIEKKFIYHFRKEIGSYFVPLLLQYLHAWRRDRDLLIDTAIAYLETQINRDPEEAMRE